MRALLEEGFVLIEKVISPEVAMLLQQEMQDQLVHYAQEIGVSFANYLYCTGRWASPSMIIGCVDDESNTLLQDRLENLLAESVKQEKCNIVCKNQYIRDAVPWHQDISYSPQSPYHYSLWLALDDVDEDSGVLHFIAGSHQWPILPAVDFWSPNYKFDETLIKKHQQQQRKVVLKKGDAVVFDSRLWHGSARSANGKNRYAYVTRWKVQGRPFPSIPEIEPAYFGMWNCYQMTENILIKGLHVFNITMEKSMDFINLIKLWQSLLQNSALIPELNRPQAIQDLGNLAVLHQAANQHYAGDLTGQIYKNVWHSLLRPLQRYW